MGHPYAHAEPGTPVDMLLFCPRCGMQHIDAPNRLEDIVHRQSGTVVDQLWTNPPHRSHLCHGCRTIWRPADFPTNGVRAIATQGKGDTWRPGEGASPARVAPEHQATVDAMVAEAEARRAAEVEDQRIADARRTIDELMALVYESDVAAGAMITMLMTPGFYEAKQRRDAARASIRSLLARVLRVPGGA